MSAVEDILQVVLLVGVLQVEAPRMDDPLVEAPLVGVLRMDDPLVGVLQVDDPLVEAPREVPP